MTSFWISARFMDLLRYFHPSPLRVFRSRDHGVNPLQLRHTAFRFPGRGWVAPGWCLACKFLYQTAFRETLTGESETSCSLRHTMAAKRTNKFGLLYCNFAYSALTCFRMGMSRSASFFSRQMQIERINLLRADVTREQRHITRS